MNINNLKKKSLDELRFSVVDVETTGMSPEFNKIIDIGIVTVENMQIKSTWETLIDPKQELDPWITYYTNIRNQHLVGKPLFRDVSSKIREKIEDSVFVAHNVAFDHTFLRNELNKVNLQLNEPRLCTVKLSKRFLPELDNYHLDAVSDHFGIKISKRHRALPDAYATAEILIKYLDDSVKNYQVKDFFDLERLQWNVKHTQDSYTENLFDPQMT